MVAVTTSMMMMAMVVLMMLMVMIRIICASCRADVQNSICLCFASSASALNEVDVKCQYLGVNGKNYYAKPWGNDSSNIQAREHEGQVSEVSSWHLPKRPLRPYDTLNPLP